MSNTEPDKRGRKIELSEYVVTPRTGKNNSCSLECRGWKGYENSYKLYTVSSRVKVSNVAVSSGTEVLEHLRLMSRSFSCVSRTEERKANSTPERGK